MVELLPKYPHWPDKLISAALNERNRMSRQEKSEKELHISSKSNVCLGKNKNILTLYLANLVFFLKLVQR